MDQPTTTPQETPQERHRRWQHLPEPLDLATTATSQEVVEHRDREDDYWREVQWMLKVSGGA